MQSNEKATNEPFSDSITSVAKKNNLKRSEQTDRTENIPRNNCFDFFESDGHIFMEPLSLVYLYYHFISGSISENLTGIVGHLVGS